MQKKAIVVGASSGIGRDLAMRLAMKGYRVGITGRRQNLLNEIKKQNPERFITSNFDISDALITKKKLEDLVSELGGLDLLVLCSGTGEINEDLDLSIDQKVIGTNVFGFTQIMNWSFNFFKEQNSGHIVSITSIAGLRGSRYTPSYNAFKAYQIIYLEGLRQKAHNSKISLTITDVRPGFVDTAMAIGENLFWLVPVKKAAKQIFDAIIAEKKVVYISKRWRIIASVYKNIPSILYNKM